MNRDQFWKIIEQARKSVEDPEEIAEAVVQELLELTPTEVISFEQHRCDLFDEAYRYDLWGVAYVINGGCSDDGFMDFRAWLMANGRKRWEAALKEPESVGRYAEPEEAFDQDMNFVANDAYERLTGKELPEGSVRESEVRVPVGQKFEEDELRTRYPALCRKFDF